MRALLARAVPEDPAKGVDVAAVRAKVKAASEKFWKAYAEQDAVRTDMSRTAKVREDARVAMLHLIGDERENLKSLREYAKGEERDAVLAALAKILDMEKRLCGF